MVGVSAPVLCHWCRRPLAPDDPGLVRWAFTDDGGRAQVRVCTDRRACHRARFADGGGFLPPAPAIAAGMRRQAKRAGRA